MLTSSWWLLIFLSAATLLALALWTAAWLHNAHRLRKSKELENLLRLHLDQANDDCETNTSDHAQLIELNVPSAHPRRGHQYDTLRLNGFQDRRWLDMVLQATLQHYVQPRYKQAVLRAYEGAIGQHKAGCPTSEAELCVHLVVPEDRPVLWRRLARTLQSLGKASASAAHNSSICVEVWTPKGRPSEHARKTWADSGLTSAVALLSSVPVHWSSLERYCGRASVKSVHASSLRALCLLATSHCRVLSVRPGTVFLSHPGTLGQLEALGEQGAVFWPDLIEGDSNVEYEFLGIKAQGFALAPSFAPSLVGALDPRLSEHPSADTRRPGGASAVRRHRRLADVSRACCTVEATQLLIDTQKHVMPLFIITGLAARPDPTYRVLGGESDLWHMVWYVSKASYVWSRKLPVLGGRMTERGVFHGLACVQYHPETEAPLLAWSVDSGDRQVGKHDTEENVLSWLPSDLTHRQELVKNVTQLVRCLGPHSRWTLRRDDSGRDQEPQSMQNEPS